MLLCHIVTTLLRGTHREQDNQRFGIDLGFDTLFPFPLSIESTFALRGWKRFFLKNHLNVHRTVGTLRPPTPNSDLVGVTNAVVD